MASMAMLNNQRVIMAEAKMRLVIMVNSGDDTGEYTNIPCLIGDEDLVRFSTWFNGDKMITHSGKPISQPV